ncbi:MAG TPA: D-glycero-beta-D-manno-heptose 1,7-bisphosphate 7-phosphatase [Caproicibacter sp.]|nr:D-glycero-beta-D-manno-heptose 1,7-bisphosphate 7-phosphatase [Caproicibacter sp.]
MKTIFLDRDGVINEDRDDYVKGVKELKIFPFVPQSIKRLNDAGLQVFVVSNQQGIAKGLFSRNDLNEMKNEIDRQVEQAGGKIEKYYFCMHLASDGCSCRKPKPGLLIKAANEYNFDTKESIMIGDSERDIIAGKNAGCKTILVLTGKLNQEEAENMESKPNYVARNLADAVDYILRDI